MLAPSPMPLTEINNAFELTKRGGSIGGVVTFEPVRRAYQRVASQTPRFQNKSGNVSPGVRLARYRQQTRYRQQRRNQPY
jgi:hypothetical protein